MERVKIKVDTKKRDDGRDTKRELEIGDKVKWGALDVQN